MCRQRTASCFSYVFITGKAGTNDNVMKTVMCVQNLCKLCCCGNTFNFFAVSVSQRLPDMYSLNLEISPGNTTTAIITFQKAVPWSTPASMPQMSAVCPRKTHKSCLGTTNDETAGYGGICLQCKVIMRRRNVWRLTLCKKGQDTSV